MGEDSNVSTSTDCQAVGEQEASSRKKISPLSFEAQQWLWDLTEDLTDLFVVPTGPSTQGSAIGRRARQTAALQFFWLVPENSPFDSFRKRLLALLDQPHLRLVEELDLVDPVDADEVDDDAADVIDLWKRGLSESVPGRQARSTHNTPEHRAILGFVERLLAAARDLDADLERLRDIRPSSDAQAVEQQSALDIALNGVRTRIRQIRVLRSLPLFDGLQQAHWSFAPTGVFLGDPLYRRLFDLMLSFQRMPLAPVEADRFLLALVTCERWRLFEMWCLFRLRDAFGFPRRGESMESWFDDGFALRCTLENQQKALVFRHPDGTVLRYQQRCPIGGDDEGYSSLSMTLVPDFVVEIGGKLAVLDAKNFRVNELGHRGAGGHETNGGQRPLLPWHQAHTYRDSITGPGGHRPDAVFLLVPDRDDTVDTNVERLFDRRVLRGTRFGGAVLPLLKDAATRCLGALLGEVGKHE